NQNYFDLTQGALIAGSNYVEEKEKGVTEADIVMFLLTKDLINNNLNRDVYKRINLSKGRAFSNQIHLLPINCRSNILLKEVFSDFIHSVLPSVDHPIVSKKWKHDPDKPYKIILDNVTGLSKNIPSKKSQWPDHLLDEKEAIFRTIIKDAKLHFENKSFEKALKMYQFSKEFLFQKGYFPTIKKINESIQTLEGLILFNNLLEDLIQGKITLKEMIDEINPYKIKLAYYEPITNNLKELELLDFASNREFHPNKQGLDLLKFIIASFLEKINKFILYPSKYFYFIIILTFLILLILGLLNNVGYINIY
ncbi:MAG: hypothetical protein AAFZ15_32285, partial [Bacteroidota bacterium]